MLFFSSIHLKSVLSSKACGPQHSQTPGHLCNVQQKERRLQQMTQLRSHRKLAALPTGNDTVLKDFISGKPVFILRKHMFSGLLHHVVGSPLPEVLKEHTVFIFCIHS